MAQDLLGIHHIHKRKRDQKKLEKFPHHKKSYRFLDKFVLFGGLLGPLVTLPQIFKIWIEKSAEDLSLISWIGYLIGASILLIYSFVHKEKPLVIIYASIVIVDLMVLISILIYGRGLL
jgi:uncharacterized protein with PQ loop repeat|tara:strand:+ start:384 stop:740 length:357 start_codon:yes stop_codon:yes gene_type:complete